MQDQDSQSKNLQQSITSLAKTQHLGPAELFFFFCVAFIVDAPTAGKPDMPDMDAFSVRGCACSFEKGTQRTQYPLIKEYTLSTQYPLIKEYTLSTQYPLIKEYTLIYRALILGSKVHSLFKGYWVLWEGVETPYREPCSRANARVSGLGFRVLGFRV